MGFMSTLFKPETKAKKYKDFSRKKEEQKRPSIRKDLRRHFYDAYDFKVLLSKESLEIMKNDKDKKASLRRQINMIANGEVDTTPRNMIMVNLKGVNSKEIDEIVNTVYTFFGNLKNEDIKEL